MRNKDFLRLIPVVGIGALLISCEVTDQELGEDLLPPDDHVFLFRDTVFDIHAYPVSGQPIVTSENRRNPQPDRLFLLGRFTDTIIGEADASVVTQFNSTSGFRNGPNTVIDSLVLYLYIQDYVGESSGDMTLRVHELTERIYMDSTYLSDFQVDGGYRTDPLAEITFTPEESNTCEVLIEDPAYLDKWLDVQSDTSIFRNDSAFKDYFRGFYITAEPNDAGSTMARVHLSDSRSKLSIRYANDSTDVDSTEGPDYRWTNLGIGPFITQKINLFRHDYTGTSLKALLDNPDAAVPYSVVQGMSGVTTRLSFTNLERWMEEEQVVINSARLVFHVVPEEESGIMQEDLPGRLILLTEPREGEFEPVYDYLAVFQQQGQGDREFGGELKARSRGMFFDTTYVYSFDMSLHFQYMVDGEETDSIFNLQLYEPEDDPRFTKIWSNLAAPDQRIRLEVVYLKL